MTLKKNNCSNSLQLFRVSVAYCLATDRKTKGNGLTTLSDRKAEWIQELMQVLDTVLQV